MAEPGNPIKIASRQRGERNAKETRENEMRRRGNGPSNLGRESQKIKLCADNQDPHGRQTKGNKTTETN